MDASALFPRSKKSNITRSRRFCKSNDLEMDQDLITDITLDHLPDLSDASVSFQIPSNNASADLLLADSTNGFDVLCNAVDDDASFAPVPSRHPRGQPLTLGELTPRVQVAPPSSRRLRSPTPTQLPSSSAKPLVIQRPLTLGHRGPDKPRKTPSPIKSIKSIHRQRDSPLVSEERFQQLRVEVETLGQEHESPTHVAAYVIELAKPDSVERTSSPHAHSKGTSNAQDSPPQSEDLLAPIPEKKDIRQDVEPAADQDVVITTGDSCHADTANVAVPALMPKSKRNPRTSKPVSQQLLSASFIYVLMMYLRPWRLEVSPSVLHSQQHTCRRRRRASHPAFRKHIQYLLANLLRCNPLMPRRN